MKRWLLACLLLSSFACSDDVAETNLSAFAEAEIARGRKEMSPAVPILRVDDLRTSLRYFRDVLGFKVEWQDGDPPDFAAVHRGDALYFLCLRCQGRGASWSHVFVKDVDQLHREYVKSGARVRRPPKDEPWGLREMHVEDVDGNVLRFGSPCKKSQ